MRYSDLRNRERHQTLREVEEKSSLQQKKGAARDRERGRKGGFEAKRAGDGNRDRDRGRDRAGCLRGVLCGRIRDLGEVCIG